MSTYEFQRIKMGNCSFMAKYLMTHTLPIMMELTLTLAYSSFSKASMTVLPSSIFKSEMDRFCSKLLLGKSSMLRVSQTEKYLSKTVQKDVTSQNPARKEARICMGKG
mmetsp:Transcript_47781/g.144502  ORF Transcript_47781/g.144502 Transcript_47781/m.144502 type:complete len:108 (+) Transcript_47781:1153-1476(+)